MILVKALVDENGNPVQEYEYGAYGKTKVGRVTDSSPTNFVENRYAYTSREWEEETGDYYYRARYYDPSEGRFLSEDPIGFDGDDYNLFRYVKNSPINRTDPTGNCTTLPTFAGCVAILVIGSTVIKSCVDQAKKSKCESATKKKQQACENTNSISTSVECSMAEKEASDACK